MANTPGQPGGHQPGGHQPEGHLPVQTPENPPVGLSLYRRSRFSRVYREDITGGHQGFMKATTDPMHYESVQGSGIFDTTIDATLVAVDTSVLDGYELASGSSYQCNIQTDVLAQSQPAQGTVEYLDRNGVSAIKVTPTEMAYMVTATQATTTIGSALDFTAGTPTLSVATRNLGSHADVPDETVGCKSCVDWPSVHVPASGSVGMGFSAMPEYMLASFETTAAWQDWRRANAAPATPVADTQLGVLCEVDMSNVAYVLLSDGSRFDPATETFASGEPVDFNDPDVRMYDANDRLIGTIITSPLSRAGGMSFSRRQVVFTFWEDGGTNYMFMGADIEYIDTFPSSDFVWSMRLTEVEIGKNYYVDEVSFHTTRKQPRSVATSDYNNDEYYVYYGYPQINIDTEQSFGYQGNSADYPGDEYIAAIFEADLPAGASVTNLGNSEYADIQLYSTREWTDDAGVIVDAFSNVFEAFTHKFRRNTNKRPAGYDKFGNPGWKFSDTFGTQALSVLGPTDNLPQDPIDVAYPTSEVLALNGWGPQNGMGFWMMPNAANTEDATVGISLETHCSGKGPALNVFYTHVDGKTHIREAVRHNDIEKRHQRGRLKHKGGRRHGQ